MSRAVLRHWQKLTMTILTTGAGGADRRRGGLLVGDRVPVRVAGGGIEASGRWSIGGGVPPGGTARAMPESFPSRGRRSRLHPRVAGSLVTYGRPCNRNISGDESQTTEDWKRTQCRQANSQESAPHAFLLRGEPRTSLKTIASASPCPVPSSVVRFLANGVFGSRTRPKHEARHFRRRAPVPPCGVNHRRHRQVAARDRSARRERRERGELRQGRRDEARVGRPVHRRSASSATTRARGFSTGFAGCTTGATGTVSPREGGGASAFFFRNRSISARKRSMSELGLTDHATSTSAGTPARRAATTSTDVGARGRPVPRRVVHLVHVVQELRHSPDNRRDDDDRDDEPEERTHASQRSEVRGQRSEVRGQEDQSCR